MATTVIERADAPRVNSEDKVLPRPRPGTPAHIIKSDAEAIEVAHRLADKFAEGAALRDRESLLPLAELDAFSQSGLWAINVPKAYGGAGVSYVTLTEVIKIISAADPSLGQIPQNHLAIVEHISSDGSEAQKRFLFGEVLKGIRFGNAFSESGWPPGSPTKLPHISRTHVREAEVRIPSGPPRSRREPPWVPGTHNPSTI